MVLVTQASRVPAASHVLWPPATPTPPHSVRRPGPRKPQGFWNYSLCLKHPSPSCLPGHRHKQIPLLSVTPSGESDWLAEREICKISSG